MKKRVVFIRSNPVNPDSRVEKEVNSLLKAGYKVTILAWDRNEDYPARNTLIKLKNAETEIIRFGIKAAYGNGMKKLKQFLIFQFRVLFWLAYHRNQYDIIHACDFDTGFVSMIVSKLYKKKMIFDIFDYLSTDPSTIFGKLIEHMENKVINWADGVIICSEKRKIQIRKTNPKRLTIIYNSPDLVEKDQIKFDLKSKNKDFVKIVYVGILQDYRLLKEMCEAILDMDGVELHIAGFGKYERFFAEIAEKNSNIIYYGKLSYEDTLNLEAQCDIMTALYDPRIGNHYYAAPNKFYEAFMLGKPLIMVKNTGMSEIIEAKEVGICIDYSKDGFIYGVNKILEMKNHWDSISSKMKQIYLDEYRWIKMENRLEELYKEILI